MLNNLTHEYNKNYYINNQQRYIYKLQWNISIKGLGYIHNI